MFHLIPTAWQIKSRGHSLDTYRLPSHVTWTKECWDEMHTLTKGALEYSLSHLPQFIKFPLKYFTERKHDPQWNLPKNSIIKSLEHLTFPKLVLVELINDKIFDMKIFWTTYNMCIPIYTCTLLISGELHLFLQGLRLHVHAYILAVYNIIMQSRWCKLLW